MKKIVELQILIVAFLMFINWPVANALENISCGNKTVKDCLNSVIDKLNEVITENNTLKQKLAATTSYNVSPDDFIQMADNSGAWTNVSGMVKEFDLPLNAKVLMLYSLTLSSTETATGAWVATRLVVDGRPLLTSGRHVQPLPSADVRESTDVLLASQDMMNLSAGHHKVELQWRGNGGKWSQYASSWYDVYGGVGGRTLSLVVLPE
ncbi:MAG: hypothetical protein HQK51_13475 [Oligoflexia bacterium]|nr:hypothetical protein [Oligoflexia bacterium]